MRQQQYGLSRTVIDDLCNIFRRFPNIAEVRVFGSRAKGNYSARSDIDLALTGDTVIPFNELMDINIQIDDLALLYKVDIIDYAKVADEPIGKHIDRVGKTLYKRGKQICSVKNRSDDNESSKSQDD